MCGKLHPVGSPVQLPPQIYANVAGCREVNLRPKLERRPALFVRVDAIEPVRGVAVPLPALRKNQRVVHTHTLKAHEVVREAIR